MTQPKRFIAGARCPHCQQIDKIRCWREDDLYKSECVHCGFSETINVAGEKIETVETVQLINFPPEDKASE